MTRKSGVLMHVSSLWGEFGIGSFGYEAKQFIDYLHKGGFSYWQVLPFSIADDVNSPYKSFSAFLGNPYFIDLPTLACDGLINWDELNTARQHTPWTCEYARLYEERYTLLNAAADRFQDKQAVYDWLEANPEIYNAVRFMALKAQNGYRMWTEWEITEADENEVYHWGFMQYMFYKQWADIRNYAHSKNIEIIGDIPIYVSYDSADVWAHPDLFDLDEGFNPRHVAGVPPDYFSEDGQLWGNPIYNWAKMKEDDFAWWKERLRNTLELFDVVRIDHFRALDTYWEIPADAKTAKRGKWRKGPGRPFIRAIKEVCGEGRLIAEDLGDIFDSTVKLIEYAGFPGMRVFQFGFGDSNESIHLPHNYPSNCVAYTGTHDNDTLLGYIWSADDETRQQVFDYCQFQGGHWDGSYDRVIQTMLACHADTVVFPLQDLLHYGSDTRMNTPGTRDGNWCWRITGDAPERIDWKRLLELNLLYGRLEMPKKEKEEAEILEKVAEKATK